MFLKPLRIFSNPSTYVFWGALGMFCYAFSIFKKDFNPFNNKFPCNFLSPLKYVTLKEF